MAMVAERAMPARPWGSTPPLHSSRSSFRRISGDRENVQASERIDRAARLSRMVVRLLPWQGSIVGLLQDLRLKPAETGGKVRAARRRGP
jgi:hypothetical protein